MASDNTPMKTPPGVSRSSEIDKRAEALRENLRKRKAQAVKKSLTSQQDSENEI